MAIFVTKPVSPDPSSALSLSSPSPSPVYLVSPSAAVSSSDAAAGTRSDSQIDFSPPLIAMVIVIATAFLIITYSRLISKHVTTPILNRYRHWRRRRRRRSHVASSAGDVESSGFNHSNSNLFDPADAYHQMFSPYGLDDSVIKTIPLSIFSAKLHFSGKKQSFVEVGKDCAVCLLEFEENDYVRTLPICCHAFHVDCIDIWLRSHANCPVCRARIFRPESPFVPLMAGRIRPSLDGILESLLLEPLDEIQSDNETPEQSISEIAPAPAPDNPDQQDDAFNFNRRNLLLKRSYSFGYERNFQSDRLALDSASATTSPWRYTRRHNNNNNFWNKRLSPFGSLTKSRVFSFRSTLLTKSPFFQRRRGVGGLFPFSESSRRSKSMASPAAGFSSSRLRCGDPEALLSPERFNRR